MSPTVLKLILETLAFILQKFAAPKGVRGFAASEEDILLSQIQAELGKLDKPGA